MDYGHPLEFATLERLRAIKAQVDPGGLFADNFPVTPANPAIG